MDGRDDPHRFTLQGDAADHERKAVHAGNVADDDSSENVRDSSSDAVRRPAQEVPILADETVFTPTGGHNDFDLAQYNSPSFAHPNINFVKDY